LLFWRLFQFCFRENEGAGSSRSYTGADSLREESICLLCRTDFQLPYSLRCRPHWLSQRPYDEFYAAIKSWGRYDLVSDPGDADLVFEVSLIWQRQADPSFGLKIFDPKTRVVLWAFIEPVPAGSGRNRVKAWDNALAKIVNDAKQIADQPAVPAGLLNQ